MLRCEICGYEHEFMIAPTHIKKHGLSTHEYKQKYPNAIMRVQTEQSKNKISQNKIGKSNEKIKNRVFSEEHKAKISKSLKAGFADGSINHWNFGGSHSEETKQKISEANKKAFNVGNEKQKLQKYERMRGGAESYHCEIVEILEETAKAKCNQCAHIFEFTHQVFYPSRLEKTKKLCPVCNPRETFSSVGENEVADFIRSIYDGIVIQNDREQLGGKEIDVYIPEFKIGLEFTGLYWHAEKQNPERNHLLWKKQFAGKRGIKLITLFEDEWHNKKEIVKSRLSGLLNAHSQKIFARNCKIELIDSQIKKQFLKANHIQDNDQPSISLGAFNGDDLVSVMTFKNTNMVKGGDGSQWELSRFCSLNNTRVIGAASKLLSHFKKNYQTGREIISYADLRWSDGDLYKSIGFEFVGTSKPSYWYMSDYKIREHRSKYMKHKILSETTSNLSEWEIMQSRGYDRIWDCGTSKWILK